jgi:hypothetical protein
MLRIDSGAYQTLIHSLSNNAVRTERSSPSDAARTTGTKTSDTVTTSDAGGRELGHLQLINERQNRAAVQIRQDGRQMERADQLLARMKNELYQIVKIYPPYPPGQKDRVKFLRSFNGLRQEIEQLTIPPDSKWQGTVPDRTVPKAQPENIPGAPSGDAASLPHPVPQAGSGTGTFTLPELPDMATDAEIQTAMDRIDKAIVTVAEKRERLAQETVQFNGQQGYEAKTAEFGKRSSEPWTFTVHGDGTAAQKSGEIRSDVANQTGGMLGRQAPAAELLG